jgi:AbrB family looped-hinge helix DNA binding protein
MAVSTISTKGQITLPARLRNKLGLKPRDRVTIEAVEDAIVVKRAGDFLALEGFLGKALPRSKERGRMVHRAAEHTRGRLR